MANRIYLDTTAVLDLLQVSHHGRDIAQLTLFDGKYLTEKVDGCTHENQTEIERLIGDLRVTKTILTHPDDDHERNVQIRNRIYELITKITAVQCNVKLAPALPVAPPVNAQFLLDLFLPESRCEEFLGDLLERYGRKLPRLGKARADWWYRKQVLTSLWPLFRAFLRRASKGSLAHLLCAVLRLCGQASWADALKKAADEEKRRSI